MYYLDYAKPVGDRWVLNFFADTEEDLKDVPTTKPYITRNGTNYGVPLDTSVVTIVEKGVKVNYVLQQGKYIAGGDVAAKLQEKTQTPEVNLVIVEPDEGYEGLSKVTVEAIPSDYIIPNGTKQITANGTTAVREFANVNVQVPATPTEEGTVTLALGSGNQAVTPTAGKNFSKVTITKPATLLPENIKKGIVIAGVTGTYEATASA